MPLGHSDLQDLQKKGDQSMVLDAGLPRSLPEYVINHGFLGNDCHVDTGSVERERAQWINRRRRRRARQRRNA